MIVKLKEIFRNATTTGKRYRTRDIFINPEHVVYVRSNDDMVRRLNEGLIEGATGDNFCTISLSRGAGGTDIIVLGSLEEINRTISKREILHG